MFKIYCSSHYKNDLFCVEVEADVSGGIFRFDIIGLGDRAVEESKLRVLAAIKNSGFKSVYQRKKRITVLLSPAHKKKEGSHFDLSIVISYLNKIGECIVDRDIGLLGELSLSGNVKSVRNIKAHIHQLIRAGIRNIVCPKEDEVEIKKYLSLVVQGEVSYSNNVDGGRDPGSRADLNLIFAENLNQVIEALQNKDWVSNEKLNSDNQDHKRAGGKREDGTLDKPNQEYLIDKVQGQQHVKRALMIALSGTHHMMIGGFPGTGKSMLAKSTGELIDRKSLGTDFILEKSYYQHNDFDGDQTLYTPHHTMSYGKMIGSKDKRGLVSNIDGAILVLDEWSEFDRRTIESLRQPLEDGELFGEKVNFCCIATTNFCPCGYKGSLDTKCICSPQRILSYANKLSGPVTERFDMFVCTGKNETVLIGDNNLDADESGENIPVNLSGESIKNTISRVRKLQLKRLHEYANKNNIKISDLNRKSLREFSGAIELNAGKKDLGLFNELSSQLKLNHRKSMALILLARTITDIDNKEYIDKEAILEAVGYIKNKLAVR